MTSSGGQGRASRGDPHGWNPLENYLTVHHSYLDDLRGYFVVGDDLQYDFPVEDVFEITGRVACRHGLFVDVQKTLEVNDRGQVRTVKYSYHAGVEGEKNRPIFRYDNAHRHPHHEDEHHRHRYDPSTWDEIVPPEWVGRDNWPHLNEVVEELREWWEATGQRLGPSPDASDEPAG